MTAHQLAIRLRRGIHRNRPVQIGFVLAFWLAGEAIVRLAGLPIPGGIVGMLIVLALLTSRRISISSMRRGAEWFLAEMLLFFVPAVLAILDHRELFGLLGLKILIVILVGTVAVMCVTAFTVDFCYRWSSGHGPVDPALE
jgi:holin-like protein